jgi:hypothetical protein
LEEIRITAKTLTDNEESLYNSSAGAIVKTILLYNPNDSQKEVTLKIDSVAFLFTLNSKESKILSTPIVTNSIVAKGATVNIHISGIQL